jgi:hypothetical protein
VCVSGRDGGIVTNYSAKKKTLQLQVTKSVGSVVDAASGFNVDSSPPRLGRHAHTDGKSQGREAASDSSLARVLFLHASAALCGCIRCVGARGTLRCAGGYSSSSGAKRPA